MTSFYAALERTSPFIRSLLRIIAALLFLQHGLQKYFAFPSPGPHMIPLLYVQGIIEIVGGVLLTLGIYSRLVAFILSGDMAVAYFIAHLPHGPFPVLNRGELAVLYCFVFLYLFFAGGGPISVDRLFWKRA
jgi:putative oxidoreductase